MEYSEFEIFVSLGRNVSISSPDCGTGLAPGRSLTPTRVGIRGGWFEPRGSRACGRQGGIMRRRRKASIVVALAAASVVAALTTPLPTAAEGPKKAEIETPTGPPAELQGSLPMAISYVSETATDSYGGSVFDATTNRWTLYGVEGRTDPLKAALVARLTDPADMSQVEISPVEHSYAELVAYTTQLAADTWLDGSGIAMSNVGPDPVRNQAVLELIKYDPDMAKRIYDHYGTDMLYVSTTDGPAVHPQSRTNDSAPWYGGILWTLHGFDFPNCTTAFTTRGERTYGPYILSAGHCALQVGNIARDIDQRIGVVGNRHYQNGWPDALTITSDDGASPIVWTGDTTWRYIAGWKSAQVGEQVTIDGGISGLHRFRTITSRDVCLPETVLEPGVCGITKTRGDGIACRRGDSGSPWFQYNGDQPEVLAVGVHHGAPVAAGDDNCWYTQIGNILDRFNLIMRTRWG